MVHTKKDGRHFCIYPVNGKPKWESFGRGPEALKSAQLRDLEIQRQRLLEPGSKGASPSFLEVAQGYINARHTELSPKTRNEILRSLAQYVLPLIGTKPVNQLTMLDWTTIQNGMIAGGAGNRSINTYFRYYHALLGWAVVYGFIDNNPWQQRKPLKHPKYKVDLFTIEEFRRLLQEAPGHLYLALKLIYYTGLRPGNTELFSLQWSDIDLATGAVRISGTKTQSSHRLQYIPAAFAQELSEIWLHQLQRGNWSPFVLTYEKLPIQSLKTTWKTTVASAKITHPIRLYDIRHFYITHALAAGAPIQELADRVGHSDSTMIVKVYSHMVDELRTKQPFLLPNIDQKRAHA